MFLKYKSSKTKNLDPYIYYKIVLDTKMYVIYAILHVNVLINNLLINTVLFKFIVLRINSFFLKELVRVDIMIKFLFCI